MGNAGLGDDIAALKDVSAVLEAVSAVLEAVSAVLEVGTFGGGRIVNRRIVRVATSTKATKEASYKVARVVTSTRGRDCATYISD